MPQIKPSSFPADFPMLIIRAISEGMTIRIPCESYGQEVSIAVRFRHYLKLIRDSNPAELTGLHADVKRYTDAQLITVKAGDSRKRTGREFGVVLQPYDPANDPLAKALEGWSPPLPTYQATSEVTVSPNFTPPSKPMNDKQLLEIAESHNPTAMRLLSSRQKERMEELMLGATPDDRITQ